MRPPTNATIDQRVARVETDLGRLSDRFDDFRALIDERFRATLDSLHRVEAAVTGPNATDAATAVSMAELSRRVSALEVAGTSRETRLTSLQARLDALGGVVRFIGFGGAVTMLALALGWFATNGRLP